MCYIFRRVERTTLKSSVSFCNLRNSISFLLRDVFSPLHIYSILICSHLQGIISFLWASNNSSGISYTKAVLVRPMKRLSILFRRHESDLHASMALTTAKKHPTV